MSSVVYPSFAAVAVLMAPLVACFLLCAAPSSTDAFMVMPPPPLSAPPAAIIEVVADETPAAVEGMATSISPSFRIQQSWPSSSSSSLVAPSSSSSSYSSQVSSTSQLLSAATTTPTTTTTPVATPASSSGTSSGVAITDINYNGNVPKTEADEYVVLSNPSNKNTVDLSGYYLYVATTGTQGPTFTFPKDTYLKPNTSIRIYTNEIHKETGGYSYGSGKAIWSNNGGLAVLKTPKGQKVAEFKYTGAKAS